MSNTLLTLRPIEICARSFDRVVVFGDSLSDSGNSFALSEGRDSREPYFEGRASNGPTWVEHVAGAFGHAPLSASRNGGDNYAYRGARTGDGVTKRTDDLEVPNVGQQIDEFRTNNQSLSDRDLVVLWAGHNDLGFDRASPQTVVNNLMSHVSELHELGGSKFLVGNIFSPIRNQFELPGGKRFNGMLADTIETWQSNAHVSADILDVVALWDRVRDDPLSFGLEDISNPAFDENSGSIAANVDAYAWWDRLHPSATLHRVIAREALNRISSFQHGDFDEDGALTVADLNQLTRSVGNGNRVFDLNFDLKVDGNDRTVWIEQLKQTYLGDSDLDGQFDSRDLVAAFRAGEYEDAIIGNSTWSTGDWNGDGDFDTQDISAAFAAGGYNSGFRVEAEIVPEPRVFVLAGVAIAALPSVVRRRLS